MKYFGTDGIRGIAGKFLDKKLIIKIARALVRFYKKNKLCKVLLVGNDSRISSDYILSNLESILLEYGINVENLGKCSSPCLAYITKKFNYPLSMMISASHNSSEYNGIKFFNANGEKISENTEIELEKFIDIKTSLGEKNFALRKNVEFLKDFYVSHLKELKNFNFPLIIDCANGGVSEICKQIFEKSKIIHANPNGYNINHDCGCTHIEFLRSICLKEHKVGLAFDGDADRIQIVDEYGNVISGDKILYILSKFYLKSNDKIIGTIYSNVGLEQSLKKREIELIRANVGDKNVYETMKKFHAEIGGEDAGHIIIKHLLNTGDGVLIGILICNILHITKLKITELLKDYKEFYQEHSTIPISKPFKLNEDIRFLIKKFEKDGARIIIRPSGTEPILRIMAEHENKSIAKKTVESLKNFIKSNYL